MIFTFCFLFLGRTSPGPNIEEGKCLEALCPPVVYLFYCSKLHWCLPLLSADSNALISFMVNSIIPFSTPQRLSQQQCQSLSCVRFFVTSRTVAPARLLCPWDSLGKNTGVGCHSLLQRIFLTQGSNLGLLYCWQILYHLSYRDGLYKVYKVDYGLKWIMYNHFLLILTYTI